uniref:Uncharacterized protein n=1 Tax=Aliivibrio fischeri TaxID=668 RepID=H2ES55_ALIFS|nr:hypothetical protein [Aliivibrio fischeri]AEY78222.1 hypothetical protein [Aliivibrio fischeri]
MLNLIISFMLGVFVTVWYLYLDLTFNFDASMTVNIVIASAAMIATAIHFDSVRTQRKERLWEINKDSILRLSKALADAIEITSNQCDKEMGIAINDSLDKANEVDNSLNNMLSDSLNVYKPLLSESLILAIEEYQKEEMAISNKWHTDEYTTYEAYDELLGIRKKLQLVVLQYIKKVSGVSYE